MVASADERLGDPLALEDWDWMKATGIWRWEAMEMTMVTTEVVSRTRSHVVKMGPFRPRLRANPNPLVTLSIDISSISSAVP